jgi:hypothetical protein
MPFAKYAIAGAVLLAAAYSSSQTFLASVPVPDYPQAIAVNPFTNRVYVIEEDQLARCGLANVNNGAPMKTIRSELRIHLRLRCFVAQRLRVAR